jgi:predicted RNA-binding protein with EMAP domain
MATARSGTGSGGKWHLVCLLQVLGEVAMTHQEKKYQALEAEYESVKKQLKQSMELIEEYTNKIGEWNNAFQSVAADRDFLIKCILDHKRLIQLPTEPDRLLYSNCKDVVRNPSK